MLSQFAASGDNFANAFNVFLTYPFVDEVVGRDPQVARNLHMGDYTNLSIQLDLDLTTGTTGLPTLPTNLPTIIDPTIIINNVLECLQSGSLTSPACQKVLDHPNDLLKLREECQKQENKDKDVCKELNRPSPTLPLPTDLPTVLPHHDPAAQPARRRCPRCCVAGLRRGRAPAGERSPGRRRTDVRSS